MPYFEIKSGGDTPAKPIIWILIFDQMQIGQHFDFSVRDRFKVSTGASRYKKSHPGWDYTVKSNRDGSGTVWRTA
jgi:hypothetical protein